MTSRQAQTSKELKQARDNWKAAEEKRKNLEDEFGPGSGFGDPDAYDAYKHSVEAARYEETRCYQVYLDLKKLTNEENDEILESKPNFYGISLNLNKLFRKIFRRHQS